MRTVRRFPAQGWFGASAIFHYLGPGLAVLLFAQVGVLGVGWLRIAGVRTQRNLLAPMLAVGGVAVLADIRLLGEPLGFVFAFANLALFVLYVVLGHRIANTGAPEAGRWGGIDQIGAAMIIAAIVATPFGVGEAAAAFLHPGWLLAGIGVGICSSVIPYVIDQFVMARLRRATFALMLSTLPACATVIGMIVLTQLPTTQDLAGIALVMAGVAIHQHIPTRGETCNTHDSAAPA